MKQVVFLLLYTGCVVTSPSLAQSYVEQSNGLSVPTMENGDTEIEFSDVNGDGHVDLVCIGDHGSPYVNADEHGVMVWFGDGTGQWSVTQYGNFGYGGVALGDVNGDGLMDVGYGCHHDWNGGDLGDQILEVALGDGTGTYWIPWDDGLATNGETWGMFGTDFADVDGDGDLDVGSISFGCCAGVHVYLNNGDGTWTQSWGFLGGNAADTFLFGDINGDGAADFIAAHGDGTVYLGDGSGGFTLADGNLPGGSWRWGIDLGDVNDDGRDDLVFLNSGILEVWTWNEGNQWADLSGDLASYGEFDLAQISDMNLDGYGDVVAFRSGSFSGSPGTVGIVYGDGTGNWLNPITFQTASNDDHAAFRAGTDVDHNGYPDLVVVQEEYVGGFPIPWRNRPRVFVESTTPETTWIHPVSPRGGETLRAGAVAFIDWHAAVTGGPLLMTIELSTTGPSGPWLSVAVNVPDNGRYQWHLPESLPLTSNAYLRFILNSDPQVSVVTPDPFTILGIECPGDLTGDGVVNIDDIFTILGLWGDCDDPCPPHCVGDLTEDCTVNIDDIFAILGQWGPCE